MRIISGIHKSKRLMAPKKLPVRPTTDFAKEGLFNIINNKIDYSESTLLDIFSGTGNISYEFGSRGGKEIIAVDSFYGCVKYIESITLELDLPITTIKSDVLRYLNSCTKKFDIIFADPPYDFKINQLEELSETVFNKGLLNEEGMLIIEHKKQSNLSSLNNFKESRRYGDSVFSFFS
jgi:16S rRNA (guanine966-N2)-methyltransferase